MNMEDVTIFNWQKGSRKIGKYVGWHQFWG